MQIWVRYDSRHQSIKLYNTTLLEFITSHCKCAVNTCSKLPSLCILFYETSKETFQNYLLTL